MMSGLMEGILTSTALICFGLYQLVYKPSSSIAAVPGPYILKLTSLVSRYYIFTGQVHQWVHSLHLEHGPIVQFSPGEVSIITKDGVDSIYSSYRFSKPDFYKSLEFGGPNVGSLRDRDRHMIRKRVLSKGFSKRSLAGLEEMVLEVGIRPLIVQLDLLASSHQEFDIYNLGTHYFFDLIGMLALSEKLNLITNKHHPIKKWLLDSQVYSIFNYHFPGLKLGERWVGKAGYDALQQFCHHKILERQKTTDKHQNNDILSLLLKNQYLNKEIVIPDIEVAGEIVMQFLAGVEATGSTLAWLVKLLLKHPDVLTRLQKELDQAFPNKEDKITITKLHSLCPYLDAVIFESLRMYPVLGGFLPRLVPKNGYTFADHFIPEGIEVGISGYAYHRSPLLWNNPDEFNPDRFLGPDSQSNRSHLMTFLKGPHGCLGREFGLMGLSLMIAYLLHNYNLSINPDKLNFKSTQYIALKSSDNYVLVSVNHRG